jgi:riboflavin synthase
MFTGIIEATGSVTGIETIGKNRHFWINSPLLPHLHIDQSIAHNGVCLTVDSLSETAYRVTAIDETLHKTNLGSWETGTVLNLEQCMVMNGRLDGHMVQGHVDTVSTCISKTDEEGSWVFRFEIPEKFTRLIIEKGSIAVNGVSLTLFDVTINSFSVAIIPYTYHHTNLQYVLPGTEVNIEFDIIGKYLNRLHQLQSLSNP